MLKLFGKLPSGWTRSQYAQDFITTLSAMRNYIAFDLPKVKNGDNGRTWMHEDVALV
ncbi:KilA-N domain-containing protein [Elizabethkingia meningoseptica]|nr:KilA-N domain-containing protein [Elizabethkingia meningoseptica]